MIFCILHGIYAWPFGDCSAQWNRILSHEVLVVMGCRMFNVAMTKSLRVGIGTQAVEGGGEWVK